MTFFPLPPPHLFSSSLYLLSPFLSPLSLLPLYLTNHNPSVLFRQTHPYRHNPTIRIQRIRNKWSLWIRYNNQKNFYFLAQGCWRRDECLRQAVEGLEDEEKGYEGGDEMW